MSQPSDKPVYSIGVLLLNDIHHVWHAAPIAFALSKLAKCDVTIYYSTERNKQAALQVARVFKGHSCQFEKLTLPFLYKLYGRIRRRPFPKISRIFKVHAHRLLQHDVILSPDFSVQDLMRLRKRENTRFVMCFHGAGHGAIIYQQNLDQYDMLLLPGESLKNSLAQKSPHLAAKLKVIGYPKFDAVDKAVQTPIFKNDKPVVIYNPHFSETLSSWQPWGLHVLEWFAQQDQLNLIFAPHLMLYRKRRLNYEDLPSKLHQHPQIYIAKPDDIRCTDMTFIRQAHIYMGDISSQVYEFIQQPKPCLFLNSRRIAWQTDPHYQQWQLGPVFNQLDDALAALPTASEWQQKYIAVQKKLFYETFSSQDVSASEQAAAVIQKLLG